MTIDAGLKKVEAGDWEGGLAALAAAWSKTRCTKLAGEIDRLSAHALASVPPLAGEGKALQKAWEDRCAEGKLVGVEHLLTGIRDGTAVHVRARCPRSQD